MINLSNLLFFKIILELTYLMIMNYYLILLYSSDLILRVD